MFKTPQEIAALNLPGIPTRAEHVLRLAKRSKWNLRKKQSGKGFEIELPAHLQAKVIEACGTAIKIEAPSDDKRLTARLYIVQMFKSYCRNHGLKMMNAELGFMAMYDAQSRSGAAEPFSRWVFDVYPSFSVASLRNWRARAAENPSELKDGYGNRKGQSVLGRAHGGRVAQAIEAIICERQLMSAGHIRDLIRIDFGTELELDGRMVPLPNIRSFERYIDGWKKENPELYEKAINPDGWRNKYMLALGDASSSIQHLNQRWEIDASPMDVLCKDGRYVIYALTDVWSRRLMLHVSRTATTDGSLQLIRRACIEWGMPTSIKTDNGSDFTSHRFKAALLHLGVEQVISGPFQPWKKAFVERIIKTFQHGFAPTMPGFIGHSVADRKKIEGAKSFANKLGTDNAARFQVEMDHTELQMHIDNWVDGAYHQRPHSSLDGMTPFARAASSTEKLRMVNDIRALDVLLAPVAGTRAVGKEGIRVEGARFWHEELTTYMGKDVYVRLNPDDMGRIYVFDLNDKFICEAMNYDRLGANRAEVVSTAKALQKKVLNETMADIKKRARRDYSPGKIAEKMFSDNAKAAAKVKAFPKQSELYTTPSLDEAARAVNKEAYAPMVTDEETAQQEAFVASFKDYQQNKAPALTDEEIWWDRAKDLEARLAAGETLSAGDLGFLDTAQKSSWYATRTEFEAMRGSKT